MTRPFTMLCLGLIALVTLGSTGCVAQRQADDLRTVNRRLESQLLELQAEIDQKNATIAALQGSPDQQAELLSELQGAYAERDRLRTALEQAELALRELQGQGAALPIELDAALKQLAAQYPQLMSYDSDLGMIQLRSDLTFGLGSTQLSEQAQQSLNQLANVLQQPAARDFEVRVVGHTDTVPVKNARNVQKYEDNWGLSAFRAISVMRQLGSAGIPSQRMSIAGYGQYKPVVPNGPQGAAANRRVELYLKPMSATPSISQSPTPTSTRQAAPAQAQPAQPRPVTDSPAMFK